LVRMQVGCPSGHAFSVLSRYISGPRHERSQRSRRS
jgi:hypothetical protein